MLEWVRDCGCRDPAIRATPAFIALTAVVIINNIASLSSCCWCFVDNQVWHHPHRSFSCPFLWIDCQFYCQKHPISCCLLSLFVILLFRCEGQFNHQQYKSITSLFETNILRYAENPFKVHLTNLKHFVLSAEAVTR